MFIELTRVFKKLTPEAKEKAQEYITNTMKSLKLGDEDEDTLPLKWYEEQGLKAPDELYQKEESDGVTFSMDEDTVDAESRYLCNVSLVEDFERFEEKTIITYESGKEVIVKEDLTGILKMIRNNG